MTTRKELSGGAEAEARRQEASRKAVAIYQGLLALGVDPQALQMTQAAYQAMQRQLTQRIDVLVRENDQLRQALQQRQRRA